MIAELVKRVFCAAWLQVVDGMANKNVRSMSQSPIAECYSIFRE